MIIDVKILNKIFANIKQQNLKKILHDQFGFHIGNQVDLARENQFIQLTALRIKQEKSYCHLNRAEKAFDETYLFMIFKSLQHLGGGAGTF